MRVLVVDDMGDTRQVFRAMCESLHHEVLEAEDGKRAVEISLEEKPDLVLMDLRMPTVDGLLAAMALRAIRDFGSTPIIAITAHYSEKARIDAIAAGCDDCIGKPISRDQLAAVLGRYIRLPREGKVELERGHKAPAPTESVKLRRAVR